jgi:hypothetical protein
MVSRDLRDGDPRRIGTSQRRARPVQASQQHISRGTHAEKFGATHPQRSLRNADFGAECRHIYLLIEALVDGLLEIGHDGDVMLPRLGRVVRLASDQAIDRRMKKLLRSALATSYALSGRQAARCVQKGAEISGRPHGRAGVFCSRAAARSAAPSTPCCTLRAARAIARSTPTRNHRCIVGACLGSNRARACHLFAR